MSGWAMRKTFTRGHVGRSCRQARGPGRKTHGVNDDCRCCPSAAKFSEHRVDFVITGNITREGERAFAPVCGEFLDPRLQFFILCK